MKELQELYLNFLMLHKGLQQLMEVLMSGEIENKLYYPTIIIVPLDLHGVELFVS